MPWTSHATIPSGSPEGRSGRGVLNDPAGVGVELAENLCILFWFPKMKTAIWAKKARHKLATERNRAKKRDEENCGLQRTAVLWQIMA